MIFLDVVGAGAGEQYGWETERKENTRGFVGIGLVLAGGVNIEARGGGTGLGVVV